MRKGKTFGSVLLWFILTCSLLYAVVYCFKDYYWGMDLNAITFTDVFVAVCFTFTAYSCVRHFFAVCSVYKKVLHSKRVKRKRESYAERYSKIK